VNRSEQENLLLIAGEKYISGDFCRSTRGKKTSRRCCIRPGCCQFHVSGDARSIYGKVVANQGAIRQFKMPNLRFELIGRPEFSKGPANEIIFSMAWLTHSAVCVISALAKMNSGTTRVYI
jgi:hypothetical protein